MVVLVQVGRYNSAYKTRWTFGTLSQAVMWYNGLNIGRGYKKRLLVDDKVYDRQLSSRWD